MRLVTTSFGLFARRRKGAKKEKLRQRRSLGIARFLFLLSQSSIMDIFLRGLLYRSHCLLELSRVSPPCTLICSPVSSPYCLALHAPARFGPACRAQNGGSGIQYLRSFHVWTIPVRSLSYSLPPFPPPLLPAGIRSGYCCSPCARNIDPSANYIVLFHIHTLQPIHPTSGRALFDARQLSWSIVSHSFGNAPKNFSRLFTGLLAI